MLREASKGPSTILIPQTNSSHLGGTLTFIANLLSGYRKCTEQVFTFCISIF